MYLILLAQNYIIEVHIGDQFLFNRSCLMHGYRIFSYMKNFFTQKRMEEWMM